MSKEEALYGRLLWEARDSLQGLLAEYKYRTEECGSAQDFKDLHDEILGEIEAIRDKI